VRSRRHGTRRLMASAKAHRVLAGERQREASTLPDLKAERATSQTEADPIRYVARGIGADTESERAIRWLLALMVLCCDPSAIAPTPRHGIDRRDVA
jgi:hypothetical protein